MSILDGLNPPQLQAVTHVDGPLLILAGPGSGKTRVIAHRIAHLVSEVEVEPWRIMAVTFTNKAARELRDRVENLLGGQSRAITLGTFHSVCSRILRIDGQVIGVPKGFVIYDDGDQMALMKKAVAEFGLDPKQYPPRAVLSVISKAKSEMITPDAFERTTRTYFEEVTARLYRRYQAMLTDNSALDFDDILTKTVELLREDAETLERYRARYEHVMVDEFQDTNVVQYVLARQLAPPPEANICVVGDPDQSIYSWRSADIRNILNFEKDYTKATVVRLEQNYRSTQTILDAAQKIIALNTQRKDKTLWTEKGKGDPIVVFEAYNEELEASFVAGEVKRMTRQSGIKPGDIAVMYRTNAQSRAIEERFVQERLPYRLVGGTRFYERREIKDLLAYLRLVLNPFDSISLERVLNVPPRRIGDKTQNELAAWARSLEVPAYTALQMLGPIEEQTGKRANGQSRSADEEVGADVARSNARGKKQNPRQGSLEAQDATGASLFDLVPSPRFVSTAQDTAIPNPFGSQAKGSLQSFLALLNELIAEAPVLTVSGLLDLIVAKTRYRDYLIEAFPVDGEDRWENVQELRNVASQFDELEQEHALMRFLEDVALMSDADEYDEKVEATTLISLHSAKGLEFPIVFMIGMEEGILPHTRSFDDPHQMEEERRLCYVGVTRAKERLYLLHAFNRTTFGRTGHNPPSRFLKDLPPELVHRSSEGVERAYERPSLSERTRQPAWSTPGNGNAGGFGYAGTSRVRDDAPARALAMFSAGERVRHAKFGEGIVVNARQTSNGADQEVTVAFKGEGGVKKLLLSFAPLEKLE